MQCSLSLHYLADGKVAFCAAFSPVATMLENGWISYIVDRGSEMLTKKN